MRMIGVVLTPLSGACISWDLLLYYWEKFNNEQPLKTPRGILAGLDNPSDCERAKIGRSTLLYQFKRKSRHARIQGRKKDPMRRSGQ
jgi:hypothetical protein